jgi:hypothetical protein
MRYQAQSTASEVRAIVTHGRLLLARAVRAAWQARLVTRDPDGIFSSVLGARDVEELVASVEAATIEVPAAATRSEAAAGRERLVAPRLVQLLGSIGCAPIAHDIVAATLTIELDATARSLASYLRGVL